MASLIAVTVLLRAQAAVLNPAEDERNHKAKANILNPAGCAGAEGGRVRKPSVKEIVRNILFSLSLSLSVYIYIYI